MHSNEKYPIIIIMVQIQKPNYLDISLSTEKRNELKEHMYTEREKKRRWVFVTFEYVEKFLQKYLCNCAHTLTCTVTFLHVELWKKVMANTMFENNNEGGKRNSWTTHTYMCMKNDSFSSTHIHILNLN